MSKTIILWFFFFFLGFVLINYPFVGIFDRKIFIFGYPLLYVYLFVGWLISIFVVYIFSKKLDNEE